MWSVLTLLIFLLLTPSPSHVSGLKCFTCSHHKGTTTLACPSSSSDLASFQTSKRYYDVGDSSENSCSIRHSGTSGSRFVCCSVDGCNWSLDTAQSNSSPLDTLLTTALPFILAAVIVLVVLAICLAVCCSAGTCGTCCGCLGCACCDRADKAKFKKTGRREEDGETININDRYKSLARPGSESSQHTAVTPIGSPRPDNRESVTASSNKAKDNQITVQAAENNEQNKDDTKEVNLKASQISDVDGVKNPEEVDNDRITRTARYYFQPAYKQK